MIPERRPDRALADFKADPRLLLLAAMSVVVGAGGAFAAFALIKLIALVTNLVWFGRIDAGSLSLAHVVRSPWMVVAPALGGLVVGLMARFGSDKIRGHGIPEAIEAILIGGSRLSPKVAVLKPLSSAIAIGTGGPFGAEGPIIMTGGAIGSLFAQGFHLSAAERKTVLVAGAAAGMTAIFGTPLAAVLLAVELLLFEWRPRSLVPVTVAAVTANCLRPMLFGAEPLFAVRLVAQSPMTLPACAGVGLAVGLLAIALSKTLYATEDTFEHLGLHWMWWPMLGGIAVGLGGLIEPRALGVGYAVIGDLLAGRMVLQAVVAILVVKAVIWLISLSSGTSGGVLAPLLILGGAAGWLMGLALPGPQGLWALVGMAAMLGGALRAPLTSAVFAVELTGDVSVLPMVLAGAVAAYATTVLLMKRSILTEKISRRGRHIACEYGVDPHELSRAGEVMVRDVEVLSAGATTAHALAVVEAGRRPVYPVVDAAGRTVGLVSRADALRWRVEGVADDGSLQECLKSTDLPLVYPQDTTAWVIEQMLASEQEGVPVVDPETGALVGLVTLKDLLRVRADGMKLETDRARFWNTPRRAAGRLARGRNA